MGILEGKNLLITGVLTDSSIAFHVARLAQEQGANVVLTSFGRAAGLTKRIAGRLPKEAPIVQLDVTSKEDLDNLADAVREHLPYLLVTLFNRLQFLLQHAQSFQLPCRGPF